MVLNTLAVVAAGVLTSGLAAVGVDAAAHHDATPTASACHHRLDKLPDTLRSDLQQARKQPLGERGKAVREVRNKALHGDYGKPAQRWATHRIYRQARIAAHLPDQLRTDVKALRKLPADQRPEARKKIRARVLAGDYGKDAQQRAEKRVQHREECAAKRS